MDNERHAIEVGRGRPVVIICGPGQLGADMARAIALAGMIPRSLVAELQQRETERVRRLSAAFEQLAGAGISAREALEAMAAKIQPDEPPQPKYRGRPPERRSGRRGQKRRQWE